MSTVTGQGNKILTEIKQRSRVYKEALRVAPSTNTLPTLPCYITELIIGKSCATYAQTVVVLPVFPKLRRIEIGDGSFANSYALRVEKNAVLRSVVIGSNCFTRKTEGDDGLEVLACPQLVSLTIGAGSFTSTKRLTLNDLDQLSEFDYHPSSLQSCTTLFFFHCDMLNTVSFPPASFKQVRILRLDSMAELQTIVFGENSCVGVEDESSFSCIGANCRGVSSLDCPSLKLIDFGDNIHSMSLSSYSLFSLKSWGGLGT